MIYYTFLLLIIVVVSVIAIWMYRAIFGVGRSVYQSNLVGGRKVSKRAKARLKVRRKARAQNAGSSSSSGIPTPWGWKDNAALPHEAYVAHKPGSLRGHAHAGVNVFAVAPAPATARKNVGWPYKEEKMQFAGKAYKVNRRAADGGDLNGDGKPWVW